MNLIKTAVRMVIEGLTEDLICCSEIERHGYVNVP
jgi:hypothetical protein